jgi:hypothetical protein
MTSWPSRSNVVPMRVATTEGMAHSRATIAGLDRTPPESVTSAPTRENSTVQTENHRAHQDIAGVEPIEFGLRVDDTDHARVSARRGGLAVERATPISPK